ncbi:succinate dehydrogenase subunit 7B, mitochondrial [Ziziphus jujuba]|uniref:Succinate dehydrogenase subunit 7B, mitochondrial n=1 Tax=Ziziphus jujuba TaxID=326968 RepID=A0A6P3ZT92_ZIZJJ|nr:succinate dehydrogenase subunit 7B, mitochondrial [Ziziphus jujuba]
MAFFMNNTTIGSRLRSHLQTQNDASYLSGRQFHTELGPREKALLADDPILNRYKSHNKSVRLVKRLGDVLTIVVVAGCCYEIYVRAVMREEARKQG